jgi:predicted glutamine amidotransferase
MCVIIVKKQGVNVPSMAIMKQAYNANPHGCGFAVSKSNGKMYMFKSLNFKEFANKFYKNVSTDDCCIIHFRLATHGSKCRANCHPFTNGKGLYFAHNGVLPIQSVDNKTDSQILFDAVLAPAAEIYGLYSHTFSQIVDSVRETSKFAFLDKCGVQTFGNFENVNGLLFSNLRGLYALQSPPSYLNDYRSYSFYNQLFSEHNKAYKTKKFDFSN